jgi:hypothetical protein
MAAVDGECVVGTPERGVWGGKTVCLVPYSSSSTTTTNSNQLWKLGAIVSVIGIGCMWLGTLGAIGSIFRFQLVELVRYLPVIATLLCGTGTLLFGAGLKDTTPEDDTSAAESLPTAAQNVSGVCKVYGDRFLPEIFTRGCHWFPRLLA